MNETANICQLCVFVKMSYVQVTEIEKEEDEEGKRKKERICSITHKISS